jgi:hypothetical protein
MPKVIESKTLVHKPSGRRVSPFGAVPWYTDEEAKEWELVSAGYTIAWDDGTVGIGRKPFATAAEAEAFIKANPRFGGMSRFTS